MDDQEKQPSLLEVEMASQAEEQQPQKSRFNILARLIGRDVHWLPQAVVLTIVGAIVTGVIASGTSLYNNRCESFPFAFQQIRDSTCTPPAPFPPQDFVIVSSKILRSAGSDVSGSTLESVSRGIEAEIQRSELPENLGVVELIESSNSWIDPANSLEEMKQSVRDQAELFNADIVIYGQVSQGQNIVFEPAFYVHQANPEAIRSLIDVVDPEALDVQLPILEGQSLQVSDWVGGIRGFAVGLQFYRQSGDLAGDVASLPERILKLELALEAFDSVPDTVQPEFYAITNLYAGNTALQLALLAQAQYEIEQNCLSGLCLEYDVSLIQRYLTAWDYYTIAVENGRDDLVIRGLIGRGNIHYRLAIINRTSDSDDTPFINYDCYNDSSLYIIEDGELESEITWSQRALAARECYEQVVEASDSQSLIQAKGLFGAGQTLQWLGRQVDDEDLLLDGFDRYSRIVENYTSASDEDRTNEELICLTGFAYGERAQIRWLSSDDAIRAVPERVNDLEAAINILENAPPQCDATETIDRYQIDLESL